MQNNNETYGTQYPAWLGALMGVSGGLGTAGSGLYNLFSKQKNPWDQAQPWLNQIPEKGNEYLSPYMDAGKGALSDLQNQYKDLLGGDTQTQLGQSYKESPGYQFKLRQAMEAGNRGAAAGGGLGSTGHQLSSADMGQKLASEDYDKYMQNQMELYGLGLSGEQGLNTQGYNASQDMASLWNDYLNNMGQGSYLDQASQNQAKGKSFGDIFGGLGTAGMSALGGATTGGLDALMKLFGGHGQGA